MATDHDEVERTEAPSPRWVAQAREHGIRPHSAELVLAFTLLAGVLAAHFAGSSLVDGLTVLLTRKLTSVDIVRPPTESLASWRGDVSGVVRTVIPFLLIPVVIAAIANIVQVGLRFQPDTLLPNPSRLNVVHGLSRILSGQAVQRSLLGTAKFLAIFVFGLFCLWYESAALGRIATQSPADFMHSAGGIVLRISTKLAAAVVFLGCLDYVRAWFSYQQQIRMSRAELTAEMRESEGDPHLRRRRRHLQVELGLPKWDKVLTPGDIVYVGKGRLAVVIRHSGHAPATILAKAVGLSADRLQRIARCCGAKVLRDDSTARAIYRSGQAGENLHASLLALIAGLGHRSTADSSHKAIT